MTQPGAGDAGRAADRSATEALAQAADAATAAQLEGPHRPGGRLAAIDAGVEMLGVLVLNAIVLLVLANATGRYLFSRPLVWTEEVVVILVLWLIMIGTFLSLSRRNLMASSVLIDRMSPRAAPWVAGATHLLAAAVFAWIAQVGWAYLGVFGGDRTPYFGVPKATYMAALPAGAAAMALASLIAAVTTLRPAR
jgi:TRAP-type C4-dicarboxylate transport system permease small subunit